MMHCWHIQNWHGIISNAQELFDKYFLRTYNNETKKGLSNITISFLIKNKHWEQAVKLHSVQESPVYFIILTNK